MNAKLLLEAGEVIAPELVEGLGPAVKKATRLAGEAIDAIMAPEKAATARTAARTSRRAAENPMDALSNATFDRIRNEGRVLNRWMGEPLEAWTGEFKIAPAAFDRMRSTFGRFVSKLKDAESGAEGARKVLYAHRVFESEFVPALEDAGIEISPLCNRHGGVKLMTDLPLHPAFPLKSGETANLNKSPALRKALAELTNDPIGETPEFLTLQSIAQHGRGRVPTFLRDDIYTTARDNPLFKDLRDPGFDASITQGKFPTAPLRIEIEFPKKFAHDKQPDSVLRTAYTRFEEGAHVFQFLNEQPLSTMGLRLHQGVQVPGLDLAPLLEDEKYEKHMPRFVVENELLGVAQELGLPLRTKFITGYHRGTASVMNLAPDPVAARAGLARFEESSGGFYARLRDRWRDNYGLGWVGHAR